MKIQQKTRGKIIIRYFNIVCIILAVPFHFVNGYLLLLEYIYFYSKCV